MVIRKKREHEVPEHQAASDPATIESLRNWKLLKYFQVHGMKAHIRLLEYIIGMWDPDQQHFVVGIHILAIEVEGIYFMTRLSMRGIPVSLSGARGGETSLDDLIEQYCTLGTKSQSGKLRIQSIVDCPLRTIVYTIGKVTETRYANLTTRSHMLYALECMEPTMFNWCEGMLVSLKNQLDKCKRGMLK